MAQDSSLTPLPELKPQANDSRGAQLPPLPSSSSGSSWAGPPVLPPPPAPQGYPPWTSAVIAVLSTTAALILCILLWLTVQVEEAAEGTLALLLDSCNHRTRVALWQALVALAGPPQMPPAPLPSLASTQDILRRRAAARAAAQVMQVALGSISGYDGAEEGRSFHGDPAEAGRAAWGQGGLGGGGGGAVLPTVVVHPDGAVVVATKEGSAGAEGGGCAAAAGTGEAAGLGLPQAPGTPRVPERRAGGWHHPPSAPAPPPALPQPVFLSLAHVYGGSMGGQGG